MGDKRASCISCDKSEICVVFNNIDKGLMDAYHLGMFGDFTTVQTVRHLVGSRCAKYKYESKVMIG